MGCSVVKTDICGEAAHHPPHEGEEQVTRRLEEPSSEPGAGQQGQTPF